MKTNFKIKLYDLLKKDSRLWDEEKKELNETLLKDLIDKLDEKLIELLLSEKEAKEMFFIKVKDVFVFKQNELKFFIDENKLENSYTQYKNEIGLRIGNKLLSERDEVVLDWPFKDCVLEGGMTKEDQKRNEIFFNEILAKDEIDRLFDPKALVNWKRYTIRGEEKVKELKRDKDGTIRENLIIKGNNLLALYSLKEQFSGKVKLIYIDPPYNTDGDSFKYNDSFNHSTWLTFMRNRLQISKDLMHKSGCIFIHIDYIEFAYLKVLCDEVFGVENFVQIISVKTATPAGFKVVNPGPINVTEFVLMYTKDKKSFNFRKGYVEAPYQKDYKYYITNPDNSPESWIISDVKSKAIEILGFTSEKEIKEKYGSGIANFIIDKKIEHFVLENASIVFATYGPHKPSEILKELISQSNKNPESIVYQEREDNSPFILKNGRLFAFYDKKLNEIDGKLTSTQLLTDFWSDLSWDTLSFEGGVTLKNGKKPERFLKRIIEVFSDDDAIILDFYLGSGTTAAVAHKMKRHYIGVEQLDYGENDSVVRLKNVINGDQSGVSKLVNWQGGGDFVCAELAKWNEEAKEKILKAKSLTELEKLFDELYERYFLNYNVKTKEFKEKILKEKGFKNLSLDEQRNLFVEMLDMNQLYVNFSERADKKYNLSKEDIALSEEFYNKK